VSSEPASNFVIPRPALPTRLPRRSPGRHRGVDRGGDCSSLFKKDMEAAFLLRRPTTGGINDDIRCRSAGRAYSRAFQKTSLRLRRHSTLRLDKPSHWSFAAAPVAGIWVSSGVGSSPGMRTSVTAWSRVSIASRFSSTMAAAAIANT
jgi:hypothetical protein